MIEGAESYNLYYKGSTTIKLLDSTTSNTYTDDVDLYNGYIVTYYISAVIGGIEQQMSDGVTITTIVP